MTDFTLSGLPVGNADEFPIESVAALTGSFVVAGTVNGMISAAASANMSGTISPTVTGGNATLISAATSFASSLVRMNTTVEPTLEPRAAMGGALTAALAAGVTSTDIGAMPIHAATLMSGGFITGAVVQGQIDAAASANMTGGASFNQFIGLGDVSGNEELFAAASANMTGEPDPLKDGGSPPFIFPNGVDSYVYHSDATNADLRGGANFSCVVVFDPEVVNNGQSGVIVGKHDPGSTEHGWKIEYDDTTGFLTVTVSSAATGADRAERSTNTTGIRTRTVFVFTWDSTNLELYVAGSSEQGAQTDVGTVGAMVASDAQFAIGAEDTLTTAAEFFRGSVHCVYIFDDVLTSGEAATITESGYLPDALEDANLVVAWRPDRIASSPVGFTLVDWLDEISGLSLLRVGEPYCFPGIISHFRQPADEWDMDFLNVPNVIGNDQNLASNYSLSTSGTDASQNGTFRFSVAFTGESEPEIVSGFRDHLNDITIIWGGRHDLNSAIDVEFIDFLGLRVFYEAATSDLFIFQGDTGTPTRFEFGDEGVPGLVAEPDGPVTVFALRYNSQLAQFTFFINGVKFFELSTSVTGSPASNTGIRMCGAAPSGVGASWGSINPAVGQADRRGAVVYPACLPDILLQQALQGFAPDVVGTSDLFFRPLRAAARRVEPVGSEFSFREFIFEYGLAHPEDDVAPEPAPDFRRSYHLGSGSVSLRALPVNGEQVRIQDGTTNILFEFGTLTTGDVAVVIGVSPSTAIDNLRTAVAGTALNLTIGPTVTVLDNGVVGAYGRIIQDDLADGDLPRAAVVTSLQDPTILFTTGPYRVLGPVGTLELRGQPSMNDKFIVNDGAMNASFTFGMNVTIGATVKDTIDNLVIAVNASSLTVTAAPTVEVDLTGDGTTEAAYTRLTHAASDEVEANYPSRGSVATLIGPNVSGNLEANGLAQPTQYVESIAQPPVPDVRSFDLTAMGLTWWPFVDSPYAVLEAEGDGSGGGALPPFINPQPTIVSVTADLTKTVTASVNAGPTDAGDVRGWWEVEIVPGDPTFNLRIDEIDDTFSVNRTRVDQFAIAEGLNFDELRIRFVIQSQLDPDQLWFTLYTRMEGVNFDNGTTTTIILPGAGAPEPPPTIALTLTTAEQAFVLEEAAAAAQRQLTLSTRSRYKLTGVFVNGRLDPRVTARNIEGLEFGLLSVLEDFDELGIEVRTHTVGSQDVGFLDAVAVRFYGPGFEDFWWAIAIANNIIDPKFDMFVGQRLVIPPRETITAFLARKPDPSGGR